MYLFIIFFLSSLDQNKIICYNKSMKQLSIFQDEKQIKTCVFTGHRELPLGFPKRKLKTTIEGLISLGVDTFLCGMAIGFDLLAAETVLSLKKNYPQIKLVACIPCICQEKYFSKTDQKRYTDAVKKADEQVILSDSYYRGCMQVRDKYMAERGDVMVAYCTKKEGGAAYTVRCFEKAHPDAEIIFV